VPKIDLWIGFSLEKYLCDLLQFKTLILGLSEKEGDLAG